MMRFAKSGLVTTLLSLTLSASVLAQQGSGGRGFDTASLDKSAQACQDFNQFANGGWIANNPVPAAYPSWGRFNELSERNRDTLHQILEDSAKNTKAVKGSNEQKIGDYYASCMAEDKVEAAGLKPLQPQLARLAALKDAKGLQAAIADLHTSGVAVAFVFGANQDAKDSKQVIGEADQGGLGLPDRDYYFKDDDKSKTIRAAYLTYVAKLFTLAGDDAGKAAAEAQAVMVLEAKLAKASRTRVELRDPNANYNKMSVAQIGQLTPNFSWPAYFKNIGATQIITVNVGQPDFFKELNTQLTATSLDDWKTYLRFHAISSAAPSLSSAFVNANFDFYSKALTGTTENLPRWKRCVTATNGALGEAVGQVYVQKVFTPETKARALEMVQNLSLALRDDLKTLDWMSDPTRQQAQVKLDAFLRKIGYPDTWRDYSALQVEPGAYLENRMRAIRFETARDLRKIGKPVDRMEWGMTPPTVNAYYNPAINEIVFPAGILQPPFYDPKADDAINYGGIGAVIGHEMTHGFDDQGRQYDAQGNLKDWWQPADLSKFNERAACVVKQFDNYFVEDGLHLNGKLVVGESIADLGGLAIAYRAFQKSLEGKPRPASIEGFTPEQRFFMGWAQVWAQNARPEYVRLLANVDPHPLARFRVNGPLSNLPQFAQAFGCQAGDKMVRPAADRCQIW